MKIKHNEIDIPVENPFENCKLDRKKYAEILTSIIGNYADGFVLAVNNEWGTGKTTFVKMWQQYLNNAEYKTLYFNAWANDFDSNPLVAILAELKTLTPKENDATFKSLMKKGAVLSHHIIPVIVKALAKKYIDTELITEAIGKLTEAATDILKEEVDEYSKKKKGLIAFRNTLEEFVQKSTTRKPLIFLIDELDRCKPDYAVEVLEQVKHFFNVPGIVFVLSIDKKQLGNAIKGYYGSEQIDSDGYLKRFIDLEYTIPQPDTRAFCNYLYDYFQFKNFLELPIRKQQREFEEDKELLIDYSVALFEQGNRTLREQEKIFASLKVILGLFHNNSYIFPTLLILLIYLRSFNESIYIKIKKREFTTQELIDRVAEIYPLSAFQSNSMFIHCEALLVHFYYNYRYEIDRQEKLIQLAVGTNNRHLQITPVTDRSANSPHFLNELESFARSSFKNAKIDYLLKKIDLTENISN